MLVTAAITTGPAGVDANATRVAAETALRRSANRGAHLIVLPELFASPYVAAEAPDRWRHLAERADGATARWASSLAGELDVTIVFGAPINDGKPRALNCALAALPNGQIHRLAEKVNLPPRHGAPHGEEDHFRAGRTPPTTLTIGGARIGAIVCYDRRYPECWRRLLAAGADVIAVLVAGPAPDDPPGIYEAELRTHGRANAAFVAVAARCGVETVTGREVRHDGRTMTLDCAGRVHHRAKPAAGGIAWLRISDDALHAARAARMRRTKGMGRYARAEGGEPHE